MKRREVGFSGNLRQFPLEQSELVKVNKDDDNDWV